MKTLLTLYPQIGASFSIAGSIASFVHTTFPYLQYLGVGSSIFIAWYTFYLQRKQNNKK